MKAKVKGSNRGKKGTTKEVGNQRNPDLQSVRKFHEQHYSETENRFEEFRNILTMQQIETSSSEFIPSSMSLPFGQKFIQYKDVFYIGEVRKGKPYGKGKFFYKNGGWEDGEYKNSVRVGSGSIKYNEGVLYSGEWSIYGAEGEGMIFYPDWQYGAIYTGQFVKGIMHGKGTINFKTGNWYKGDWENGKMSGQGVYYNAKHRRTDTGQFTDGYRTGVGVIEWGTGDHYEGTWDDTSGSLNGEGTIYSLNDDYETGKWVDGNWIGEEKVKEKKKVTELFPGISGKITSFLFFIPWPVLVFIIIRTWISSGFWYALLVTVVGSIVACLSMLILGFLQLVVEIMIKRFLRRKSENQRPK
jgi:hypothetical protein